MWDSRDICASPEGIAAVPVPSTNGPPFCHQLASSLALRQLPAAMAAQSDPRLHARADRVILDAAADLESTSGSVNGPLSKQLRDTAAGLRAAAGTPTDDQRTAVARTLGELGEEIQNQCQFPIG
jgi:hypothetical protein